MSNHTPTPWTAQGLNLYSEDGVLVAIVYQDRGAIELHGNAAFIVRACNSHEALKTNAADSRWLLRELLSRCKDPEWRARIEAQIGASDTVLALVGGAA